MPLLAAAHSSLHNLSNPSKVHRHLSRLCQLLCSSRAAALMKVDLARCQLPPEALQPPTERTGKS